MKTSSDNDTKADNTSSIPESSIEAYDVSCTTISPFTKSRPRGLLSGVQNGASDLAIGAGSGVVLLVGAPIAIGIEGYRNYGVVGSLGGSLVGLIVGGVAATVAIVGGGVSCLYQIGYGLYRSPREMYASLFKGKHWDVLTEKWVYLDLPSDANRYLALSQKDFKLALNENNSIDHIRNLISPSEESDSSENSDKPRKPSTYVVKKNLKDRELYDILGVEPEATQAELKRAYYVKARQHHPDRAGKGDDASAAKFQRIGHAYQILSDDNLRAAYDRKGQSAVDETQTVDASVLYAMLFGSERFENYIGELHLATCIKDVIQHDLSSVMSSKVSEFIQARREIQLAAHLASKFQLFLDGDAQVFEEKNRVEAEELSESPLGAVLLNLIGSVYLECAACERSTGSAVYTSIQSSVEGIGRIFGTFGYLFSAARSSIDMYQFQVSLKAKQDAAEKVKEEASSFDAPTSSIPAQPKPSRVKSPEEEFLSLRNTASKEDSAKLAAKMKKTTSSTLALMWHLSKADISSTLRGVCRRLLRDKSASKKTLDSRCEALRILGAAFVKKGSVPFDKAMESFMAVLEMRTGMFGDAAHSMPAFDDDDVVIVGDEEKK